MALHSDDPSAEGNLTDREYWALVDAMAERGRAQGEPPCRMSVPPDELAAALARLGGGS